ncbi:MAG TPA: hypothetical protein ENG16_04765, partial [Archaeoglobus sp.]|nr:hypothetical protein [Archaeoglobus sp.]
MDVQTRKSILWDAFEELKSKWSIDEKFLESKEKVEEPTVNGLPESKVGELMDIKQKYQLDDLEFLFLVGAAIGFYQGQKNVKEVVLRKISTLN